MPTLDYLTGFNHRVAALDYTNGGTAAPTISTSIARRAGGSSLRIPPLSSQTSYAQWTIPSTNSVVIVGYIYFETALPSSTIPQLLHIGSTGIQLSTAGNKFFQELGGSDIATDLGPTAVNTWYRFELVYDGTNALVSIRIALADGPPAANQITNLSITGGAVTTVRLGVDNAANITTPNAIYFADVVWSTQLGDYPIGPVQVYGYTPASVGTHNLDASTSAYFFSETQAPPGGTTTALTTSETTSYQSIDDVPLDGGTDAIKVVLAPGSPNTPVFRAAGTTAFSANNVANGTLAPGAPAGKAVGDLLVLVCTSTSTAATVTTPTGWNLVTNNKSGTSLGGQVWVYSRIADGTANDTPTPSFASLTTGTSGTPASATILAVQNAQAVLDGTVQVSDLSAQTNTSVIPAFTTGTNNSYVVGVAIKILESSGQTSTVATFTERVDQSTTSGGGYIVEVSDKVQATAGSSGTATVTWSATTSARALAVSLGFKATVPLTQPTNTWYTEHGFGPIASQPAIGQNPYAVRAIVAQELDTAVASTWVAKLFDSAQGSNLEDIANGSISTTTRTYVGKTFPGRPATVDDRTGTDASAGSNVGDTTREQVSIGIFGGKYLESVELYVFKSGSPTDNLIVEVQGSVPGSSAPDGVVRGTSVSIAGSSLTTSPVLTSFAVKAPLPDSTANYWIVIRRSGAIDGTNFYKTEIKTAGAGGTETKLVSGVWSVATITTTIRYRTTAESFWTYSALINTRLRFGYTAAADGHPRLADAMLEVAFPIPAFVAPPILKPSSVVPNRIIQYLLT